MTVLNKNTYKPNMRCVNDILTENHTKHRQWIPSYSQWVREKTNAFVESKQLDEFDHYKKHDKCHNVRKAQVPVCSELKVDINIGHPVVDPSHQLFCQFLSVEIEENR